MDIKRHWEKIYSTKPVKNLGWFTPHLHTSLSWINDLALNKNAQIIDIGGGASTLVDDLAAQGYSSITVLDLSRRALEIAKTRMGDTAALINWLQGDVTTIDLPPQYYTLWHDRAVFHFLVSLDQQNKYRNKLHHALGPGGYVIIGTFAQEAPPTCSGLPVTRYSHKSLTAALGEGFELIKYGKEPHHTPSGIEQVYLYCMFRKHPWRLA